MKNIPAAPAPEKKERKPLSTFSKGMIIAISVLALLLVALTLLDAGGIHLISPDIIPLGCIAMLLGFLAWGAHGIYGRIKTDSRKRIFVLVAMIIIMIIGLLTTNMTMQVTQLSMAHHYATIESPTGQKVAIMHVMDVPLGDEEQVAALYARMDARYAALKEEAGAEPVDSELVGDYPYAAYGQVFSAFPKHLGLFYTSNVEAEGLIYRGVESESKLLFEWLDDNTLHLYLENPEPGDSGSVKLSLAG